MFKIGDQAWYADRRRVLRWVLCPHCFGQKALTVILGDQSQVSIDCDCCRMGVEGCKGYLQSSEEISDVRLVTIERIEMKKDTIEYGFNGNYYCDQANLFLLKEAAEQRALELVSQHAEEEKKRLNMKDRADRSWAWHVKYHRESLKRAEKDIKYHTTKLTVAKEKAKEPHAAA